MTIKIRPSDFLAVPIIFSVLILGPAGPTQAGQSWQEKMLFNPPTSQLEREQRGSIMIYDGLRDAQITRALDTQFDRIQSMMFIRTIVTDSAGEAVHDEETGEVVVEDDGC